MYNQTQLPQVIHIHGNHYQMGLQHAQQVTHLLPAIQTAIGVRYAQLELDQPDAESVAAQRRLSTTKRCSGADRTVAPTTGSPVSNS